MTVKHLTSTPDSEAWTVPLCKNPEAIKRAILKDLFGNVSFEAATIKDVKLSRPSGNTLTAKKLKSLAKKYFSIPPEIRSYYPDLPENDVESEGEPGDDGAVQASKNPKKRKKAKDTETELDIVAVGNRKPGRPKSAKTMDPGQQSIYKFFQN